MRTTGSIEETRGIIREIRRQKIPVGFVPTMGALHEGHMSLIDICKKRNAFCAMSIFVNKIQFNDKGDFAKYPRTLEADANMAAGRGADMIFTPNDEIMYANHRTYVDVEFLTDGLCGAHRPGHFRGVFTVVTKLFNIVQPDFAVFGQKDIQQAVSIEKMVKDLNIPVEIIIAPIIRESDGLALSSRNVHLSEDERLRALSLNRALKECRAQIEAGERKSSKVIENARAIIERDGRPESIDYISLVDYETLQPCGEITGKTVLALAANFGSTRLIDNEILRIN